MEDEISEEAQYSVTSICHFIPEDLACIIIYAQVNTTDQEVIHKGGNMPRATIFNRIGDPIMYKMNVSVHPAAFLLRHVS